uniref:Disease resistance R13L4/SHOC-2-like LRR domain-containing protein n=1 Tax=Fagus sylvatica TaxID=28930 RepID=A0A2N9G5M1_FAGSY
MSCGLLQLTSLQTLKLFRCRELKELPRDIKKLVTLKHLEIDCWESLTHMPYGIGQLNSLQTLPLFVVSKELTASSSKHCGGIDELNKLNNLRDVESLPEELLQNLASLEYLKIWGCPRLKSLPRFMQHLTSLKVLVIEKCEELDLCIEESDDGTQCVTTLQKLKISGVHRLITLPKWIDNVTSLKRLDIYLCPNLTSLPEEIGSLTSLLSLEINDCPNLTSLPEEIGNLTSIREFYIEECPNLTSLLEGIGNLTSLQTLIIRKCPHLKERYQEGIGEDWHKIAHIPDFEYID